MDSYVASFFPATCDWSWTQFRSYRSLGSYSDSSRSRTKLASTACVVSILSSMGSCTSESFSSLYSSFRESETSSVSVERNRDSSLSYLSSCSLLCFFSCGPRVRFCLTGLWTRTAGYCISWFCFSTVECDTLLLIFTDCISSDLESDFLEPTCGTDTLNGARSASCSFSSSFSGVRWL